MITIEGLEATEEMLDKIANIQTPMMELCRELCELAEGIVQRKYSVRAGSGNTDFTTTIEEIPNGYKMSVFGEDVGFLEFGAGVFTDSSDMFADQVGYAVYPGSWSETEGSHQFADHGFWIYRNVAFTGISPSRGMHEAYEEILNEFDERAKAKIEAWIHGS